jgi:hypothetical protein
MDHSRSAGWLASGTPDDPWRTVDLSLRLTRQAHPKSMHLLQRDSLSRVMDEMIQKNRDFYLPQKMKPDILRYFQSYVRGDQ